MQRLTDERGVAREVVRRSHDHRYFGANIPYMESHVLEGATNKLMKSRSRAKAWLPLLRSVYTLLRPRLPTAVIRAFPACNESHHSTDR